jgi:hypothetical protein
MLGTGQHDQLGAGQRTGGARPAHVSGLLEPDELVEVGGVRAGDDAHPPAVTAACAHRGAILVRQRVLWVSASGFNSTGFIRTSAATPAASACNHWAVPISPPSTTRALFDMFCALNGATSTPRRRSHRHSAVAIRLLPASLDTPCTMIAATPDVPPAAPAERAQPPPSTSRASRLSCSSAQAGQPAR